MKPIKTVFFDLGNVLIFVNFSKLLFGLGEISGLGADEIQDFFMNSGIREKYETGKITTNELYLSLKKRGKKFFSIDVFLNTFSNIFTPNIEAWKVVEKLKHQNIRLILLSNTSEPHFKYAIKNYPVLDHFDAHILSYKIGAWKPDHLIFKSALDIAGCDPDECFYTDDIPEFIDSAKKAGLPGEVFISANQLIKQLRLRCPL